VDIKVLGERLVEACHDPDKFRQELSHLQPREVLEAQVFLWDFCLRLSQEREKTLNRSQITARMVGTPSYQYSVGCNERVDYCRANICVYTNPVCASNKLRGQMEALRELLAELLG